MTTTPRDVCFSCQDLFVEPTVGDKSELAKVQRDRRECAWCANQILIGRRTLAVNLARKAQRQAEYTPSFFERLAVLIRSRASSITTRRRHGGRK